MANIDIPSHPLLALPFLVACGGAFEKSEDSPSVEADCPGYCADLAPALAAILVEGGEEAAPDEGTILEICATAPAEADCAACTLWIEAELMAPYSVLSDCACWVDPDFDPYCADVLDYYEGGADELAETCDCDSKF